MVGYDWDGRAACIGAALWPERVSGLVSVDGYNLQDFGSVFDLTAASFANPDFVDVVIHFYRHRFGRVGGDPEYEDIERRLAEQPTIYGRPVRR